MTVNNDILTFMNTYWKPNQDDAYIVVENSSNNYKILEDWFMNHKDFKINIGPFKGVKPYGMFEDEENPNERTEFLFIYDDIDRTKLEKQHLQI